jgi:hypothetical protein
MYLLLKLRFSSRRCLYLILAILLSPLGFLTKLAALGTDTSLFSGSCSDDCPSLLSVPAVVGTYTSLFSVNEIKISVTQEKLLKKSWKVGKKKLHQRKITPVIIWDFGGQDENLDTLTHFYSYL